MQRMDLSPSDGMSLAHELFSAGRFAEAARVYQGVAIAENGNFDAVLGAGISNNMLKDYPEAVRWFDRAGTISLTQLIAAALNKAAALGEMGRTHEALRTLDDLLRLYPNHAQAIYNRGILRMQVERFQEAIADFDQSLALAPDASYGNVEYARGFSNLVLGNYQDGFREFEYREKDTIPTNGEEWNGDQSITGKTVLVHAEMGSGDTIQFSRYLPMMVERGAHVFAVVHPGITPLLEGMEGVTLLSEDPTTWPVTDYWVRLMSLAWCFGTTVSTVPAPTPIKPNLDCFMRWRHQMQPGQGRFNIGLCWSGNPASKYDVHRSIPAALLAPLVGLAKRLPIRFYSFQQKVRERDLDSFQSFDVFDLGPRLTDFRETANAMANLDLMITCDTSVAHMAGTVGVPTWVLLTKFRTYWLWMLGRDTTPWYPSMKCFKQRVDGDWQSVVAGVTERVAHLVKGVSA